MLVLGIETSCDETSIGIIQSRDGDFPQVLSHRLYSQVDIHNEWGGVVPEIAARNHLAKLTPLLKKSFNDAQLATKEIDLIAVTTIPGLLGPLLTGLNAAKSLALLNETPIMPVNHLYAHLEAIHLTKNISYPYIGLLVSGGHSLFAQVNSPSDFKILGSTIDDAAGEAFDKGGKLMGMGYPAGRLIDDLAKQGDKFRFKFPIGLQSSKDSRMSFSGVKTSLRNFVEKNSEYIIRGEKDLTKQQLKDLCASYQHAIVSALSLKLGYAIEKSGLESPPIVVGGGVACNSALREILQQNYQNVHFVEPKYCTDNGVMIANYGLRTQAEATPFPDCLELDARGKFIKKTLDRDK